MLSYGMLVLTTAALAGIQTCQGTEGGHCPRNDCSLQATANRSYIDCWIKEGCSPFPHFSRTYPLKPENLQVIVYRTANDHLQFNITWQPGLNENINYLRGYQISIGEKFGDGHEVCFEMEFSNTLQKLDPQTDGELMLYSDCISGFTRGIEKDREYMIKVQSLPVPESGDEVTYISDDSVFIGYCDISVTSGSVVPRGEPIYYINNEVVEVICDDGHKLIGASALKCQSKTGKGTWNDTIPECIEYYVEVEVFLNQSALVKFLLPDCPGGHFVRLRDLTHDTAPPDKEKLVKTGYTVMYENLTFGRWQAFVNFCQNGEEKEFRSEAFNIIGPTTTKTTTTAAATTTTTAPTTTITTAATTNNEEPTTTPSTPFYSIKLSPSTNVKKPLKKPITYVFSVVGCVVGLLLVVLVFRLRSSYKRGTSHTDLQEESQNTESSMVVGNVCLTPDLPLNCSHNDAFTICSQSLIGVETGIRPSGSV